MSRDIVLSRKLAPIYDFIDDHNYKGAVKLCQKKDLQDLDVVQCIVAFCFLNLNKEAEGLAIARAIKVQGDASYRCEYI